MSVAYVAMVNGNAVSKNMVSLDAAKSVALESASPNDVVVVEAYPAAATAGTSQYVYDWENSIWTKDDQPRS